MIPIIPAEDSPGLVRKAANAVNALIRGAVQKDGATIYAGDTAGGAYDQTKMQALMDAVEALSNRLE